MWVPGTKSRLSSLIPVFLMKSITGNWLLFFFSINCIMFLPTGNFIIKWFPLTLTRPPAKNKT